MADVVLWVVLAVVAVFVLWTVFTYNKLVTLKNRVQNAWSQIDVQLKKRFDLVPNLVETVKGYAKHERETFETITRARAAMANAKGVKDAAAADNLLTGALKTLFAVAENYPQLRANENFKHLQEELSGLESKIAYARQFYNDSTTEFNISLETFPTNLVAGMFGFGKRDLFEIGGTEREVVKVKF